jgi:hypothetical protein
MDTCKLFIGLFIISTISYSQIKTDFLIADSGSTPFFDFDTNNKIHMVWTNNQKRDKSVQYSILDSSGNIISTARRLSTSINGGNPSLAIRKDYIACIWGDKVGLDFTVFGTFIIGKILKDGLDYTEEMEIDDFEITRTDAHRILPGLIWHNDSILYSYWYGDGALSNPFLGGDIYAQKMVFPPLRKSHPLNYVLDNPQVKVNEILPTVIKKSAGAGYLSVWVEKDSLNVLRIAGVSCDDSLKPNSSKITFVNLDSVKFYISKPTVFHKQNGNIIIAWEKDTTNFQANIFFQEFSEQGTPVGAVVKVNETPASATSSTVADIDSEGRFIIVWEEWPNLKAQRYSTTGTKIGVNFKVNQNQTNGDYFPITRLRNNKIYTAWNRSDINWNTSVWMNILDFDNPTMSVEKDEDYPATYLLSQNFPNPFNPTTTIAFSIPQAGNVTLKVFDALGREVATLVNGFRSEGKYNAEFDASKLSSGMYIYKLTSDKYTEVKKMMLVK